MSIYGRHQEPRKGWDIAGTDEYDTERAFQQRVQRTNARLAGNRKAQQNRNTKANRERYGVESEHFGVRLFCHADPGDAAAVLKVAAWLPGFDVVVDGGES